MLTIVSRSLRHRALGTLLAEHKSAGADFDRASCQAFEYIQSLAREDRNDEIPRYCLKAWWTVVDWNDASGRFEDRDQPVEPR